jgi:hypothetical protein
MVCVKMKREGPALDTFGAERARKRFKTERQAGPSSTEIVSSRDKAIRLETNEASSQTDTGASEGLQMARGTFDVILVVDQREALQHKDNAAILTTYLMAQRIPFTFRTLPIGDFAWICKSRIHGNGATLAASRIFMVFVRGAGNHAGLHC